MQPGAEPALAGWAASRHAGRFVLHEPLALAASGVALQVRRGRAPPNGGLGGGEGGVGGELRRHQQHRRQGGIRTPIRLDVDTGTCARCKTRCAAQGAAGSVLTVGGS
jgi:hypothetical protein